LLLVSLLLVLLPFLLLLGRSHCCFEKKKIAGSCLLRGVPGVP
jgi:hypothetical protein